MVEIRRSYDRLISTMGFPITVRRHLNIESRPTMSVLYLHHFMLGHINLCIGDGTQNFSWVSALLDTTYIELYHESLFISCYVCFHLVLCYDMICFFVVSVNIYLTWLEVRYSCEFVQITHPQFLTDALLIIANAKCIIHKSPHRK